MNNDTKTKMTLSELKSVRGVAIIATAPDGSTCKGKTIYRYDGDVYLVKLDDFHNEMRIPGSMLERDSNGADS